jgi:hypothetical protein
MQSKSYRSDSNSNYIVVRARVIVFNATFNNISVISWGSISIRVETGVPGMSSLSVSNPAQTLSFYETTQCEYSIASFIETYQNELPRLVILIDT